MAFYLPSRPVPYIAGQPALTPQIDDARILRDGMVLVCPMDDFRCKYAEARMRKQFTASRQRGVEVSRITRRRQGSMCRRYYIWNLIYGA